MGKYTTFVGMDVHSRSIEASAVDVTSGEVFNRAFGNRPTAADVAAWLEGLPQPVYCAYESGCTGFVLARGLRELGFDCDVLAVSTLPRSAKDRKQKCDRHDARAIRREIANPDAGYGTVWVPDEKTEAERDLVRAYRVAVDNAKHAKQRLVMFLLRHGYSYDEATASGRARKPWTRAFEAWLDGVDLGEPAARGAFEAYRRQVRTACQEVADLRAAVRALAEQPEHKPYVDAFTQIKGIDVENAMLARVELGDFSRFGSGRKVSCWLGTVPSDSSSGEAGRHGRITKCGDKYLRRALVEGYSGVATWKTGRKAVPKGVESPESVRSMAAKANARLHGRYVHLREGNKMNANKAKVAVVNELVRWIWAIGLEVQRSQRAGAAGA